jgi:hypothetical protein
VVIDANRVALAEDPPQLFQVAIQTSQDALEKQSRQMISVRLGVRLRTMFST